MRPGAMGIALGGILLSAGLSAIPSGPAKDPGRDSGAAEWNGHTAGVTGLAVASESGKAVSCSLDGTVRLWDPASGRPEKILASDSGELFAVSVDSKGRIAAVTRGDGKTMIIFLDGRRRLFLSGYESWSLDVALSPDGRRAAVWSMNGDIWIFDAETGKPEIVLKGDPGKWGTALCWSPDGKILAAARAAISLWDVEADRVVRLLEGHRDFVRDLDFSPDGRRLASAGADKTVRVWDVATGDEILSMKPEGFAFYAGSELITAPIGLPLTAVSFSPNGEILATGGADRVVRLWDAVSGTLLREFKGHTAAVTAVAFSGDGSEILSSGLDHVIRLWRK